VHYHRKDLTIDVEGSRKIVEGDVVAALVVLVDFVLRKRPRLVHDGCRVEDDRKRLSYRVDRLDCANAAKVALHTTPRLVDRGVHVQAL